MKSIGFRIDTKSGVVVFKQMRHGEEVVSVSKFNPEDGEFNIGVGQLIAMKRNEIKIRKIDLKDMRAVKDNLNDEAEWCADSVARKMYANYRQHADEMIKASLNHIRELKKDLRELYVGKYAQIPEDIKDGSCVYVIAGGSIGIAPRPETNKDGIIVIE